MKEDSKRKIVIKKEESFVKIRIKQIWDHDGYNKANKVSKFMLKVFFSSSKSGLKKLRKNKKFSLLQPLDVKLLKVRKAWQKFAKTDEMKGIPFKGIYSLLSTQTQDEVKYLERKENKGRVFPDKVILRLGFKLKKKRFKVIRSFHPNPNTRFCWVIKSKFSVIKKQWKML